MTTNQSTTSEFGMTACDGKKYTLTNAADYTGRLLPGGYTNYVNAENGENYDFEMSASAVDEDGVECTVYWIFSDTKGDEDPLDTYDYSTADRVQS
jgi:hypothetical protein